MLETDLVGDCSVCAQSPYFPNRERGRGAYD